MRETFTIVFGCLAVLAFYGWVANIFKIFRLIGESFDEVAVELVIRGIGVVFAPLGAIAGFL